MSEEQPKRLQIGTVEGAAFIVAILLLLVVFFHILPEVVKFNEYINSDSQELKEAVYQLQKEQDKISKQICTTNFEREIGELRATQYVLENLEGKASAAVQDQVLKTTAEIDALVTLLKSETPVKAEK